MYSQKIAVSPAMSSVICYLQDNTDYFSKQEMSASRDVRLVHKTQHH